MKFWASGFSLIEVLVTTALMSVLATGMAYMLTQQSRGAKGVQAALTRDAIVAQMLRLAADPGALKASADAEPSTGALKRCEDAAASDCSNGTNPIGFQLVDPLNTAIVISGSDTLPQYYNSKGGSCDDLRDEIYANESDTSANSAYPNECEIQAVTRFRPFCDGASPCATAKAIHVMITVSQRKKAEISGTKLAAFTATISTPLPFAYRPAVIIEDAAGNVGIGTSTPTAKLHVAGTAGNDTGVWANLSDARLKRDVATIEKALDTVSRLRGVSFRWTDPVKDQKYGLQRGFIAQEVEQTIPEWVSTGPDGYKRMEKVGVEAILVEAIKETSRQAKVQSERLDALEEENAALKADLAVLKARLNQE